MQQAASFLCIVVDVHGRIHKSGAINVQKLSFKPIFSPAVLEILSHSEAECPLASPTYTFSHVRSDICTHASTQLLYCICWPAANVVGDECFCRGCCKKTPEETVCLCSVQLKQLLSILASKIKFGIKIKT